jgi:hypothetical protein
MSTSCCSYSRSWAMCDRRRFLYVISKIFNWWVHHAVATVGPELCATDDVFSMLYPRPPTDEYIMLQLQSFLCYVRQMTFPLCYIQDLQLMSTSCCSYSWSSAMCDKWRFLYVISKTFNWWVHHAAATVGPELCATDDVYSMLYPRPLSDEKYYGHHSPTDEGFLKLDPILQQMNTGAR